MLAVGTFQDVLKHITDKKRFSSSFVHNLKGQVDWGESPTCIYKHDNVCLSVHDDMHKINNNFVLCIVHCDLTTESRTHYSVHPSDH